MVYEDTSLPDSTRYAALQRLTFILIFSDGSLAKKKIDAGLKSIEGSHGKSRFYYNLCQNLGIYYDVNQEIDSARIVFTRILNESKKRDWSDLEQRAYNNLGMNSLNSSQYRKAIGYFSEALKLSRENPDSKKSDYVNYISNLGLANQELELYDQAIKYHLEALDIRQNIGDENGMAISLANLGICHRQTGKYDQAIHYYEKAIAQAKAAGNLSQYHRIHDNLGSLYIGMGNSTKGLDMLEIALDSSDGASIDPKMKLSIYSNAAAAYVDLEQLGDAETYALLGLAELEEHPDMINYSLTLYDALAAIHFKKGDVDKGSQYLEKYRTVSKEVYNAENAELLTDLQVQYDLEKKENQIALQKAELQEANAILQRNYFAFSALGLLVMLLIATFIYYRSRSRREQQLLVKDREIKVKETHLRASLESQEIERRRMAQDLHDGFGQYLSALRIYVSQLKNEKADAAVKLELVDRTDLVLDEMSKEIGNVVYDLMPATLTRNGLISALEELATRINAGQQIQVRLHTEGIQSRYSEAVEINLFRICQEWINNVIKYAEAQLIIIDLSEHGELTKLSVRDDGHGFDPEILTQTNGNGWKNIRTRAGLLKARIDVSSRPHEKGTELLVKFPHLAGIIQNHRV